MTTFASRKMMIGHMGKVAINGRICQIKRLFNSSSKQDKPDLERITSSSIGNLHHTTFPTSSSPSSSKQKSARDKIDLIDRKKDSPFLRDRFGRQHTYLRISLTEKCNLRCVYCMPNEGVPLMPKDDALTAEEIGRLTKLFVQQGVDKIRLTGGEPTLRKDLLDIMQYLSELRKSDPSDEIGLKQIGITTNGLLLNRLLPQMITLGLTHLNVSLDTLDPFQFELMTRRPAAGLEKVLNGIETALSLGMQSVKVNVVILRGVNDDQDVLRFVRWSKDKPITIRFIEYMPFDGNRWRMEKLVPYSDLIKRIEEEFGTLTKLEDDKNDTTKHFQVPGHKSSLGFITSMTEHFCGTCNRLRITADGKVKVCLFGQEEISLRDAIRLGKIPEQFLNNDSIPLLSNSDFMEENNATDQDLLQIIGAAVGRKHARHGGENSLQNLANAAKQNRSMIRIGG